MYFVNTHTDIYQSVAKPADAVPPATASILVGSSPLLLTEPNSSDWRPIILPDPEYMLLYPAGTRPILAERQGMFRLSGSLSYTKRIVSVWE